MNLIRVLIADDHPVFRFGIKTLLEAETGFEILGEASTGEEAIALATDTKPDVVLMDITMPAINGIDATHQILETNPEIGVLIITMVDDASLFAALRAGARGYLLKGAEGEETLDAIRAVARGAAYFNKPMSKRLINYFANRSSQVDGPFPDLTPREYEVLALLAKGLTNHAIAEQLSVSPKTARNHVSVIFSKLHVKDRAEAIVLAREAGIV